MFLRKTEGFKMSYVKLTNYAIKDALLTGDPNKIVKGTDIDAEFNAIATASAVTDAAYVAADAVVTAAYVAADAVVAATVAAKLDTATAATTYAPLSSPALVGVPTAPTASVGTNTTQIATMAALLNQAFTTGFPSQTGNAGKFITTNGTSVSWAQVLPTYTGNALKVLRVNSGETDVEWVNNIGTGGGVFTTDETLVASSAAMRVVRPTAINTYTTLPDATTLDTGIALFTIFNESYFDRGVKDGSGKILGWIRPMQTSVFGLVDKTTAAGVWNITNLCKSSLVSQFSNTSLTNSGNSFKTVSIDANRQLIVFGGTSLYGVVYNSSTDTYGSVVLLATGISTSQYTIALHSTDKVLLSHYVTTPELIATVLTLTGTAISVGTPVSSALATGINGASFDSLLVNGTVIVSYTRTGTVAVVRGITVSGTTPTIGAEYTLTTVAGTTILMRAIGTTLIVPYYGSSLLYCRAYSVSGTTLTTGTETSTSANAIFRATVNGNNRLVVQYPDTPSTGTMRVGIFSLSGVNVSQSTVSIGDSPSANTSVCDMVQISASKVLVTNQVSSVNKCNIITDTAGTASAGTVVTMAGTSTTPTIALVIGNTAYVQASGGNFYGDQVLDCSGASPSITATRSVGAYAGELRAAHAPSGTYLEKSIYSYRFTTTTTTTANSKYGLTQTTQGQNEFYNANTVTPNFNDASALDYNWSYSGTTSSITLYRLRGAE